MNQQTALHELQETAFALHELVLYLDTHPENRKAFTLYKTYKKKYDQQYAAYQANHGPLNAFGVEGNTWNWNRHPWPWQCGCTHGQNATPWKGGL